MQCESWLGRSFKGVTQHTTRSCFVVAVWRDGGRERRREEGREVIRSSQALGHILSYSLYSNDNVKNP